MANKSSLLEDDASVRTLSRAVLERFGYRVFEAPNGSRWRCNCGATSGNFDLLITDLILPYGISGTELAQRLVAAKPELRVIYTSGYSNDIIARHLNVDASRVLLQKPYSAAQLATMVRHFSTACRKKWVSKTSDGADLDY